MTTVTAGRDTQLAVLSGLGYVSIAAVAVVPVGQLADSETPLLEVVRAGAPDLPMDTLYPLISMFAVANTALINMLMASRLIYGMARQDVLPPVLGWVHRGRQTPWVAILFTTAIALGLIFLKYITDTCAARRALRGQFSFFSSLRSTTWVLLTSTACPLS